ncbi:MAG: diaminopimelate decarboxylase, partial [Thermoguttaceae bacterium]
MLRTEIAGIPISSLTEKFQTPFFAYDANSIRTRVSELKKFDIIRFAQKACSNLAILRLLREEGCAVDCVSTNEIRRAQAAGFDKAETKKIHNPIVFTADIFDREALDLVVSENIPVNCGSTDMIWQLGERAPGREITLRINPGFGHGHSRKTNTGGDQSKHGI